MVRLSLISLSQMITIQSLMIIIFHNYACKSSHKSIICVRKTHYWHLDIACQARLMASLFGPMFVTGGGEGVDVGFCCRFSETWGY